MVKLNQMCPMEMMDSEMEHMPVASEFTYPQQK
jgi:hypothetical protein